MITTKQNQFISVRRFGNKYYNCICDKDKGLIAYAENPYIVINEGKTAFNMTLLNADLEKTFKFNMGESLQWVVNADSYKDFVNILRGHQSILFCLQGASIFLEEGGMTETAIYKQILNYENLLTEFVQFNEKQFTEKVVPVIPKNWPYAMFHESSWTAYDYNIQLHNFASGDVNRPAEKYGISMDDIKNFTDRGKTDALAKFNDLNGQITADLENGVYVFDEQETQTFDEPISGNE